MFADILRLSYGQKWWYTRSILPEFLVAMGLRFDHGAKKRGGHLTDWFDLKYSPGLERDYLAKIERHVAGYKATNDVKHIVSIACDAAVIFAARWNLLKDEAKQWQTNQKDST